MAESSTYERFFPVAPLLGGLFAVAFDVGYFWGIGVGFFTVFSLSEHIVFAMGALPIAMMFLLVILLIDAFVEWSKKRAERKLESQGVSALPELEQLSMRVSVLTRSVRRTRIALILVFAIGMPWLFYVGSYRQMVFVGVLFVTFVASALARGKWYNTQLPSLLLVGIVGPFLIWHYFGSESLSIKDTRETITTKGGETRTANLITTGERGILYSYPAKNKIELIP